MMRENQALDLIASELETEERAASYDRWFRAQVQAAIDDPHPDVSHATKQCRASEPRSGIAKKSASNEDGL